LFKKIVEKLDYYYHGNARDYGRAAADALVKRLKKIGSDDSIFPEYEIKMVRDAVKDLWHTA
jgi:hypothetical protein